MFLSRNKKNNVYTPVNPFYYIKVGFKGVKIIEACFRDDFFFIFHKTYYEALLMSTNNIRFYGEIRKILVFFVL